MQKISKYKVATTYAKAWLDAAKDKKAAETVLKETGLLRQSLKQDAGLWHLVSAPIESHKAALLVADFCKQIKLSAVSSAVLQLIAENNRLKFLDLILEEYTHLYYKDAGIVEVDVDTAIKLSEEQDLRLQQILSKKLHAPVVINYAIKPNILGGLAVRFNSFLIDDTLSGKIKRLKQMMLNKN